MMSFYVLRIVYAAKVVVQLQLAKYYRVKFTQEIFSRLFPVCFHDLRESVGASLKIVCTQGFYSLEILACWDKSGNFVVVHMPSVGFMYSKAVKKTG